MRNERGFTLIEIVMVIVLIGILAAVAIPRFLNLQDEAGDAFILRIVIGEMPANVSLSRSAQESIRDGVKENIGIGVPGQSLRERNLYPS